MMQVHRPIHFFILDYGKSAVQCTHSNKVSAGRHSFRRTIVPADSMGWYCGHFVSPGQRALRSTVVHTRVALRERSS